MTVPWPIVALAAVFGLAIGSFLNVVIYRVPRNESIVSPGSHCPTCSAAIKGRHNVPLVSWVLLRGRCYDCTAPISGRYPLVEGGTALLFAAVTLRFGMTVALPAYLYLTAAGVALAMIDFDVRRLPDSIVLPSYLVSVLLLMPAGAVHADWHSGVRALVGMITFLLLFLGLALAYPNGLWLSDVKFAGVLGLYLGWLSWQAVLFAAVGSLVLAGAGGAVITVRSTVSRHGSRPAGAAAVSSANAVAVPIGPCLIGAAVLALFLAAPVGSLYGALAAT